MPLPSASAGQSPPHTPRASTTLPSQSQGRRLLCTATIINGATAVVHHADALIHIAVRIRVGRAVATTDANGIQHIARTITGSIRNGVTTHSAVAPGPLHTPHSSRVRHNRQCHRRCHRHPPNRRRTHRPRPHIAPRSHNRRLEFQSIRSRRWPRGRCTPRIHRQHPAQSS